MAKTIKYTYRDWVPFLSSEGDVDKRLVVSKTNVSSTTTSFLSIGFKTYYPGDFDPNVGDTLDITYDFTIPRSYWDTADDGTTALANKFLGNIFYYTSKIKVGINSKAIIISKPIALDVDDILDALADPTKAVRIVVPDLAFNGNSDHLYVAKNRAPEITFIDSPSRVEINEKVVSSMSINGEDVTEIAIDGHTYSFSNDLTVTQQEVAEFVTAHTTWVTDPSLPADQTYRMTYDGTEYVDGINPPTSGGALSAWNEFKKDALYHDFTDSYEKLINEVSSPTIKSISSSGTDRVVWTKIAFPNLEICARNINYGSSLIDVTLPEKFNTPAQLTTLFGSAANIAKITFHWIGADGTLPTKGVFAEIDTTAKLKGLAVEYSKSVGIADSESITATVKYDAAVADHLNGGTSDVVYTGLVIANPDRTVTEQEVDDYADANILWPTAGPEILSSSDYTSITGVSNIIKITGWDSGQTGLANKPTTSIVIQFKTTTTISRNYHENWDIKIADGTGTNGYTLGLNIFSGVGTFAAGEIWEFKDGSKPTKLTSLPAPAVTSANLDITKWPALHPGTKLYTPDLHMVDGKEITLTVQADHGFTVNGGDSVDYQYIPSSGPVLPSTTYSILESDYTSMSNTTGSITLITGWVNPPTANVALANSETLYVEFKNDITLTASVGIAFRNPSGSGTQYYVPNNPFSSFAIKAGDKLIFEPGKDPVKVS